MCWGNLVDSNQQIANTAEVHSALTMEGTDDHQPLIILKADKKKNHNPIFLIFSTKPTAKIQIMHY